MAFVNTVGDEELLERAQKALRPHGVHLGWAPDAAEVIVSVDDAQTRRPATVSRGLLQRRAGRTQRRIPRPSVASAMRNPAEPARLVRPFRELGCNPTAQGAGDR